MTTFWVLETIRAQLWLDNNNPELSERLLIHLALVPSGSLLIADWKTCLARSDKRKKTKTSATTVQSWKRRITHLKNVGLRLIQPIIDCWRIISKLLAHWQVFKRLKRPVFLVNIWVNIKTYMNVTTKIDLITSFKAVNYIAKNLNLQFFERSQRKWFISRIFERTQLTVRLKDVSGLFE